MVTVTIAVPGTMRSARPETRKRPALADGKPAQPGRQPVDGGTAQHVALHARAVIVHEAQVEGREGRHRAGRAHEVVDAGRADCRGQLAVEPGADLVTQRAVV